ncbi:uncharacterized protein LOC127128069 isoform X2 [Lathyrus oleraceus]|uniref:uncharacterized protein LOC127128069 isoform X2 n=1 Tax=Pisum sativum TaxID=3888 RepID=UPI0021CF1C02|nr:uncharacterized protein LOC127128069 isoform X2 [Pisum sativum]
MQVTLSSCYTSNSFLHYGFRFYYIILLYNLSLDQASTSFFNFSVITFIINTGNFDIKITKIHPIMIDKSWIDNPIESNEFKNGVVQFLDFAFSNAAIKGRILCPCITCNFRSLGNRAEVTNHLLQKGFPSKYTSWYMHGEKLVQANVKSELQLKRPRCQWEAILSTSPKKDGKYMNEEGIDIAVKRSQYLSEDQDHAVSLGVLSKVLAHSDGTVRDVCKLEVLDQVCVGEKDISNLKDLDDTNTFGMYSPSTDSFDNSCQKNFEDLKIYAETLEEKLIGYEETKQQLAQVQNQLTIVQKFLQHKFGEEWHSFHQGIPPF